MKFSGVSWQHPIVRRVLPLVDLAERPVLTRRQLGHLPPFSIRARSTGIRHQFGGGLFASEDQTLDEIRGLVDLQPTEDFLDVGCGAGRAAFALRDYLDYGRYTGLDVDLVQIEACRMNKVLTAAGCHFVHITARNDLYSPQVAETAAGLAFPFEDASFDVVHLISLFTHMLSSDVESYAAQIVRVLRSGGRAVVSYYGKDDRPKVDTALQFDHRGDATAWLAYPGRPLKAVAYEAATLDRWFGIPRTGSVEGSWRTGGSGTLLQDLAIYTKP